MTPFITLEDINSTFLKYGHVNSFHECDTSKLNKTGLYTNITYDFLKISKTSTGFEFQIENNLWSGGYYLLDNDGEYFIPEDATCTWNDDTPTITVTTSEENVTLVLYLTSLYDEFYFEVLKWRPVKLEQYNYTPATANPIHEEILDLRGLLSPGDTFTANNITDGQHTETLKVIEENDKLYLTTDSTVDSIGIFKFRSNSSNGYLYYSRFMESKIIEITPNVESITLGKINKIYFNLSGTTIQNVKGTVTYNGITTDLQQDSEGYYINIDLTNIYDIDHLTITLDLHQNNMIAEASYRFRFDCNYPIVTTATELINYVRDKNVGFIQVNNNITLPEIIGGLKVDTDLTIIGNPNSEIPQVITMNGYFNITGDVTVNFKGLKFIAGNNSVGNCFIQEVNSTLNLTNCHFEHFIAHNTDLTGSIVYCKTDFDNITVDDDFRTTITGCFFKNNSNCILHGGQLLVEDCKFLHNDLNYVTGNLTDWKNINSAFLYQVDGDAAIRNSIFDIDYGEDTSLCDNQINISHAQSLVTCGLNATINGAGYEQLSEDNSLPFFNAPYSNQAHIYAQYYYSDINACVVVSPEHGREDKSLCYCRSGEEYIYKQGAKLTRKEWDTDNKNHKIIWDE